MSPATSLHFKYPQYTMPIEFDCLKYSLFFFHLASSNYSINFGLRQGRNTLRSILEATRNVCAAQRLATLDDGCIAR